jgi:hypothetical protein
MSRVYVTSHHFEPHSRTLNGLTLHVQFEGGSAEVSMMDMPGIPSSLFSFPLSRPALLADAKSTIIVWFACLYRQLDRLQYDVCYRSGFDIRAF